MNKLLIFFWGTPGVQRSIERLLVILIIGILAVLITHAYLPLKSRAWVLHGASFGLDKYRHEILYHWALYGEWPKNETDMERFNSKKFTKEGERFGEKADLENGSIHVFFNKNAGRGFLSVRPAILKENSSGSVIWVCGSGQTGSSAWTLVGSDRTTIDRHYIPISLQYY